MLAQKFLGHSNLNTIADVYTHTSAESELEAALAVERAIYGENSRSLFQELFQTKNKASVAQSTELGGYVRGFCN